MKSIALMFFAAITIPAPAMAGLTCVGQNLQVEITPDGAWMKAVIGGKTNWGKIFKKQETETGGMAYVSSEGTLIVEGEFSRFQWLGARSPRAVRCINQAKEDTWRNTWMDF